MPEHCPSCGSTYIRTCGIGTQRVEQEIRRIWPDVGAKRARQLVAGAQPLIDPKDMKPVTIAIEEINRGLLTYHRNLEDEEN